ATGEDVVFSASGRVITFHGFLKAYVEGLDREGDPEKESDDRESASRQQRARRAQSTAKVREGMRTGDERYLPARDKGPVRRFVRDYIDARLCVAELLLPLLLVIMVTSVFATSLSNGLWSATILLVALDTSLIVFRLRRELPRRFPDERTKGAVLYGVMRSIQLRWIRLPKPRVKLGAKLPARY
ncbi:MAG: DUF3043 domain-containing protein, partial [Nocardioidaceae bacterium]